MGPRPGRRAVADPHRLSYHGPAVSQRLVAWPLLAALLLAEPTVAAAGDPFIPTYAQVVDEADLLDAAAVAALQRISGALEHERGVQLAVLVVPSLEGVDPGRMAERVYQAWWYGRRHADHGLLLLYGADEGWWQLHWGPALEPELGDPARLAPVTRLLGDPARRPLGGRLVEAAALLARAAGASEEAVARPYEARRDWGRVRIALWILAAMAGVLTLAALTGVLQLQLLGRLARRLSLRQAALLSLRDDGRRLRLRSRQPVVVSLLPWLFLLPSGCPRLIDAAGEVTRGPEVLTCSHASGRCEVSVDGRPVSAAGLDVIERLEVSPRLPGRAELLAPTRWGRMVVVRDWPSGQVEALSRRLTAFLADPAAPPMLETSEAVRWGSFLLLGLGAAGLVLAGAIGWPRTLRVDRQEGWVALSGPFPGWHRSTRAVRAVRIERTVDRQVDRLRRRCEPMPYAALPDLPARILLEVEDGEPRPVTGWFPGQAIVLAAKEAETRRVQAWAHLEATARALAAGLGVPLLPLREVPPAGVVPAPMDGPAGR